MSAIDILSTVIDPFLRIFSLGPYPLDADCNAEVHIISASGVFRGCLLGQSIPSEAEK